MSVGALSTAALGIAFAGSTLAASDTAQDSTDTTKPTMTAERAAKDDTELATKFATAFAEAESAGKITAAQKTKLLELDAAVRAQITSGDRESAEAAMETMHDWMTSENIDASVMPEPPQDGHGPGFTQAK